MIEIGEKEHAFGAAEGTRMSPHLACASMRLLSIFQWAAFSIFTSGSRAARPTRPRTQPEFVPRSCDAGRLSRAAPAHRPAEERLSLIVCQISQSKQIGRPSALRIWLRVDRHHEVGAALDQLLDQRCDKLARSADIVALSRQPHLRRCCRRYGSGGRRAETAPSLVLHDWRSPERVATLSDARNASASLRVSPG